jgi:hypothetical protein
MGTNPREEIRVGMEVLGSEGHRIGSVKEIMNGGQYFHVDVPLAQDYYVPISAVESVNANQVRLRLTAQDAAYAGWELKPKADQA